MLWASALQAGGEHPRDRRALAQGYWGQGYAEEATRAVVTYAFDTLGVKGLFAGHNPGNEASRRLLTKMGFRYLCDEYYPPTGLKHPSYILTAEEFMHMPT